MKVSFGYAEARPLFVSRDITHKLFDMYCLGCSEGDGQHVNLNVDSTTYEDGTTILDLRIDCEDCGKSIHASDEKRKS